MNFNRKENKEISTISFEIRIQTRFHKKSIEVVKTIGLILFTAGKHEERNRDIRKHLITVGSLVIAVLGS